MAQKALTTSYLAQLTNANHDGVTQQEELAFLDRYLALLKQRFGEGIQVRIANEVAKTQFTECNFKQNVELRTEIYP